MTNMSLGYCEMCGANQDMVGVAHRCVPRAQEVTAEGMTSAVRGTYKYRDADAWRSYMANYMRGYRRKQRET